VLESKRFLKNCTKITRGTLKRQKTTQMETLKELFSCMREIKWQGFSPLMCSIIWLDQS